MNSPGQPTYCKLARNYGLLGATNEEAVHDGRLYGDAEVAGRLYERGIATCR